MNLNNELGFAELSEKIIAENTEDVFYYLQKETLSLIQFVGILSLFAHKHISNKYISIASEILKKRYMNNIYIELEKIPELFNEASHIAYEDIQKFFENDFSLTLVHTIAFSEQIKFNASKSIWGLIYLYTLLLKLDLKNFEIWIKKTKRIDFKVIFLNLLFNHIQNENIDVDKLKDASLGILQSFCVLVTYGLEPNSHNVWSRQSKNIEEILNSPLAEKVKFLTILKYITKKYCGTSLKKLDQDENLPQLIKLLYATNYNFTWDDLMVSTGIREACIYYRIIQLLPEKNTNKVNYFERLLEKILNYLKAEMFQEYNLDYAELIGRISTEISSLEKLEALFKKEYKQLSFPYSFCKIKNWQERISFCLYLLVGIYIYKKNNNEEFNTYIDKFRFIKSEKHHYFDQRIEELLLSLT